MKIFKRILLGLLILVVLAALGGWFFVNNLRKGALPDYNAPAVVPGIQNEVTVYRDAHAIPHIYAQTEADLYRAVGFVMAQDRLWQIDLLRRVTTGRLSEIFGADLVETDLLMRSLRITEKSEQLLDNMEPPVLAALESFAAGVNHYLQKYPLPPEFKILGYHPEPWLPVHSVNLIGYMSWDLNMSWDIEVLLQKLKEKVGDEKFSEILPDLAKHPTSVFPGFTAPAVPTEKTLLSANSKLQELGIEVFSGSNNWAVSGQKSITGQPLLANDMHLGFNAPGIWFQMHQVVEGKLNVTGVAVPGQPFIIVGHNDSVAWGMTNVMVDDMDFYEEELNADTTRYFVDGDWRDLILKKEVIAVKGGDTVWSTLRFTHRGPIVNRQQHYEKPFLSMRWIGNDQSNEIRSVYLLNHAQNWSDFREAVKTFIAISQNIVYADRAGNIGLQTCAGVPLRKGNPAGILPGTTSTFDWTGTVPFEELPFEFNPERGYVSSANNKTAPDSYPYYISYWFTPPHRIDRIREMLEATEKLGAEDFRQMHNDVKSKLAEKMLPLFFAALDTAGGLDQTGQAALAELKNWNGELTRESTGASVFEVLFRKTQENLIRDDLDTTLFKELMKNKTLLENLLMNVLANPASLWPDVAGTARTESFADLVVLSFQETVDELSGRLGHDPQTWQWQKLHTLTLKHPLGTVALLDRVMRFNRGPFDVPGSYHTVCPFAYSYLNLYHSNHGASQRHIFDLSDWDASQTVIPTGNSGNPASPFYGDQTSLFLEGRYHDDPFSAGQVKSASKFVMKITGEPVPKNRSRR